MLHQLTRDNYLGVPEIFKVFDHHLAIKSILFGLTASKIYVDDIYNPKIGVTWSGHRIYVVGIPYSDLIVREVATLLRGKFDYDKEHSESDIFVIYYAPNEWKNELYGKLGEVKIVHKNRYYYSLVASKEKNDLEIPEKFRLIEINSDILDKKLENIDLLLNEMQSERDSIEDFFEKSFGFCIAKNDKIIGWCLSEYNIGDRYEIGIETLEPYRQKGIATITANSVIDYGISKGSNKIGWHCWNTNKSSIFTAESLGFERKIEYPVISIILSNNHN